MGQADLVSGLLILPCPPTFLVRLLLTFAERGEVQYLLFRLERLMPMNTGLLLLILKQCNRPDQVS